MPFLALGLVLLLLFWYFGRKFVSADVKVLARKMRKTGGLLALAGAAFLFVTGRVQLAVPLFVVAISLLGRNLGFGGEARDAKSPGQSSTVRTATVEMHLDHDTGEMSGRVLGGRYAGRALGSLTLEETVALWRECLRDDPQGAQLIEAVLDRAEPNWREIYSAATDAAAASAAAKMTLADAYEVLGLKPGATRAEIQQAHRELMKRFHPDQGGSNYLAAKINEAKDLLLAHVSS